MKILINLIIFYVLLKFSEAKCKKREKPLIYNFPKEFHWSTATASYQIEGAWNIDGKGPSIWDEFVRKPGKIVDNSTGDISADSYHKYKEDIKLLRNLGVSQYRFSLSWPRILPRGTINFINKKGIEYYHNVIDELLANGIQPIVTLYHWDLPLALQDTGGWLNREIVEHFRKYAKFCFKEFGSKVKIWITINEPMVVAEMGHCGEGSEHAPGGLKEHCHWAPYLVAHHLLLAHAHAYRTYHGMDWKPNERGFVGIANSINWLIPETKEDEEVTKLALDRVLGWFTHPVFKYDYPPLLKERLQLVSELEGRVTSRLPQFSEYEKMMLSGSADFLGINYYITLITKRVSAGENKETDLLKSLEYGRDIPATGYLNDSWMPVGDKNSWIKSYPDGLEQLLDYIRTEYKNPDVIITENGCMDTPNEGLEDITRVRYLKGHIAAISKAISKGSRIRGYNVWSLIDNFEWGDGYTRLFGIHHVDFNDASRIRTPKLSAEVYEDIIAKNQVVIDEDCTWP